jgi:hypothetical protein
LASATFTCFCVERYFFQGGQALLLVVLQHQALNGATLEKVLGHNLGHIGRGELYIEHTLGVDEHEWAVIARAHAAGFDDVDLVFHPLAAEGFNQLFLDLERAGRDTSPTRNR